MKKNKKNVSLEEANKMQTARKEAWQANKLEVFWGEIAPCEHVVQIYDNDNIFLDTLAGFAGDGLKTGDIVMIIATQEHISALNQRLAKDGANVQSLIKSGRYIVREAEECLSEFLVNGWPDEDLFIDFVTELLSRVQPESSKVRVFGEMVALLWAKGYPGATVHLEHLWNDFCKHVAFSLFCAYPKSGFTQDTAQSLHQICNSHSKIISGEKSSMEIVYRNARH